MNCAHCVLAPEGRKIRMDSRNLPPSGAGTSLQLNPRACARGYILTPLRGWNAQLQFIHTFYERRYSLPRGVQGSQKQMFCLAIDGADVSSIDVEGAGQLCERNDGFRHGSVAAGRAEISECFFQYAAGGANVSDVPHGDNVVGIIDPAHKCPFDAFERKTEVGHLRDQIVALPAPEVNESNLVDHAAILQREAERIQRGRRQLGPFDTAHEVLVRERIKIGEGFHVPFIHFARKRERVALDSVEHRSGQPCTNGAVGTKQVLEQDGRGRAVARANVFDVALISELLRVMIDHEIDFRGRVGQMRRLKIHNRDAIEVPKALLCYFLYLDFQQLHHRNILGTGDAAVGTQRRALLVAAQNLTQRQAASNGIGIGIVLKQDQNRLRTFEMRLHFLHTPHGFRQPNVPSKVSLEQLLKGNEVGEGPVLLRDSLGLRSKYKRRNLPALSPNCFQDLGKPLGIVGLGKEQIERVLGKLLGEVTVSGALYKVRDVSVAYKILFKKTGNEIFLDIKDRLHSR